MTHSSPVRLMSDEVSGAGALVSAAIRLRDGGRIDGALTLLRQLEGISIATADLAQTYLLAGQEQLARDVLRSGVSAIIGLPDSLRYAMICKDAGLYEEEFQILSSFVENHPGNQTGQYKFAYLLAKRGHDAEAVERLSNLSNSAFENGEGAFALALLHLSRERWQDAAEYFSIAYRQRNVGAVDESVVEVYKNSFENPNRFIAIEMFYAEFRNDYFNLLAGVKFHDVEARSREICITRAWQSVSSRHLAQDVIDRDRNVNGSSATTYCLLGHEAWLKKDRAAADHNYFLAKNLYSEKEIIPFHSNCGSMVWLNEYKLLKEIILQEDRVHEGNITFFWKEFPNDTKKISFIVACDANYFAFFPSFLESLINLQKKFGESAQLHVHCHVADASDTQIIFLNELQNFSNTVLITYSLENSKYKERAYYTCLRYIVAHSVIERMRCQTYIMDIDLRVTENFVKITEELNSFDLGLRMDGFAGQSPQQIRGEPWTINAQSMYISGGDAAAEFLRIIRNYISLAYNPNNITNWTVDQCAIAQAFSWINAYVEGVSTKNLTFSSPLFETSQTYPTKEAFLNANPITQGEVLRLVQSGAVEKGVFLM